MEESRTKYILLKRRVGEIERNILSLNSDLAGTETTQTQVLQGQLLEALPETKQPQDSRQIALVGLDRKKLRLVCPTEDLTRVSDEDANLLLAILPLDERYDIFINKRRLVMGRRIHYGSSVFVRMKGVPVDLAGTVLFKGEVPPFRGTMFGVELIEAEYPGQGDPTTDGIIQNKRYFNCKKDSGVFVALDKIRLVESDNRSPKSPKKEENAHSNVGSRLTETVLQPVPNEWKLFQGAMGTLLEIDQRVVTFLKDKPVRGTVRYIGEERDPSGHPCTTVGLELDSGLGQGTGAHNGKQRFVCRRNFAIFLPIETVIHEKLFDSKPQRCKNTKGQEAVQPFRDEVVAKTLSYNVNTPGTDKQPCRRSNSFDSSAEVMMAAGESSKTNPDAFIEQQRQILMECNNARYHGHEDGDVNMRDQKRKDSGTQMDIDDMDLLDLCQEIPFKQPTGLIRHCSELEAEKRKTEQFEMRQEQLEEELIDLQDLLREKDEHEADLQERLRQKEEQKTSLQDRLRQKAERETSLQDRLRQKEERETSLQDGLRQKAERETSLQERLRQKEEQETSLQDRLRQMEERETSLQERLREKEEQETNLQEQLREKEEQETRLQEQLRLKEVQETGLQERLRQKEEQETSLQEQLREKEEQETGLQERLRQKEEQETSLQEQLRQKEEQETVLQETLRQKEEQETSLQEQLRQKEEQETVLQETLRQKEEQETRLQEQLRQKEEQETGLQERLRLEEEQETGLQERLRQKEEQETSLQEQLRQKEEQETVLQERLRQKEEQETSLQEQLRQKEEQEDSLERQLRGKEQEVQELEVTLSATQEALNEQRRQQPRDWVISQDEIHVTANAKCLGTGAWASVVEGTFRGYKVAVKKIHELVLSTFNRRLFEREMNMASRCRHPCLLQFIGATNDEGSPLFVTELMESSLRVLLEERALSQTETFAISLDVSQALNYLHLNRPSPIIHRDISSANVLLWRQGDQWRGKVSDYGAANFMRQTMTAAPGAPIYCAPEAVTSSQTIKVDVYSFGVLLCEMCIRELPDPQRRDEQIALVTSRMLRGLIRRCVHSEPETRPTMEEIIGELEQYRASS